MSRIWSIAASMVATIASTWTISADAGKPIDGSYIVTFRPSTADFRSPVLPALKDLDRHGVIPKFGEHSSGQSKSALARELGIVNGRVNSIYDQINSAHLYIDAKEAERLSRDPRVLSIRQSEWFEPHATQASPGWGLDRLDQPFLADNSTIPTNWTSTSLNNQYVYGDNATGAGQVIWVLDSGLDLGNNAIKREFCVLTAGPGSSCNNALPSRASIFHDFNGGNGYDCYGHGTNVAAIAASNTYGVAKGAEVRIVKITGVSGDACSGGGDNARWLESFNWLATNGTKGHIVNFSYGPSIAPNICPDGKNWPQQTWKELDDLIQIAHNRGVIIVVSAGNDGCNTADFSPQRGPGAFVVGATDYSQLRTPANPNGSGKDARWIQTIGGYTYSSRVGTNISAWAPGYRVDTLSWRGFPEQNSGTSLAAPYISGLFAAGCASSNGFCANMSTATDAFNLLKSQGRDTVVNFGGAPLPSGTTRLFISRTGW